MLNITERANLQSTFDIQSAPLNVPLIVVDASIHKESKYCRKNDIVVIVSDMSGRRYVLGKYNHATDNALHDPIYSMVLARTKNNTVVEFNEDSQA